MRRPLFIVMVGPSGSGKSHIVRTVLSVEIPNIVIASQDALREDFAAKHGMTYNDTFVDDVYDPRPEFDQGIIDAVGRGDDIVVDTTTLTVASRGRLLGMVEGTRYATTAMVFNHPRPVLLHRLMERNHTDPSKVIDMEMLETQLSRYVPVTEDEGFTDIIRLFV